MSTERNRALIQLFLRELSENRTRVAFDLVAAGAEVLDLARDARHGRDDERDRFSGLRTSFPDFKIELAAAVSEGSKIGIQYVIRGTHAGPYQGIPATGRRVEIPAAALFRIGDARIVEMWTVLDARSALRQIGLLGPAGIGSSERPPPPTATQPPALGASSFAPVTRAAVRRLYADVLGQARPEVLDEIADAQLLDDPPAPFGRSVGREAVGASVRDLHAALGSLRIDVRELLVQGETAFACVSYQGESRGPLLGLEPTGHRVAWASLELLQLAGSKLRARRSVFDALALLSQLEEPSTRHAGTLRLSRVDDD